MVHLVSLPYWRQNPLIPCKFGSIVTMLDDHNNWMNLPVQPFAIVGIAEMHFSDLCVASKTVDKFNLPSPSLTFSCPIVSLPSPAIEDVVDKCECSIKGVRESLRIIHNCGPHLTGLKCIEGILSTNSYESRWQSKLTDINMKLVGGASGCHDKHNPKSFFTQLLTCHGCLEEEAMSSGLRYRTDNQKSGYYHVTSDKNGERCYFLWVMPHGLGVSSTALNQRLSLIHQCPKDMSGLRSAS